MSLLTKVLDCARTGLGHLGKVVVDGGWALWHEVTDGHRRLSWWVLLGLVWLDGLLVAHWLL
jgi:hypothetical protein|tara:strand:- start:65 stop:250 length:186 start_codon:yes stop_codon:yes gene_type:complete